MEPWEYTDESDWRERQRHILGIFASGSEIAKLMGKVVGVKPPKSAQELAAEQEKKRQAQRAKELKLAAERATAAPLPAKPQTRVGELGLPEVLREGKWQRLLPGQGVVPPRPEPSPAAVSGPGAPLPEFKAGWGKGLPSPKEWQILGGKVANVLYPQIPIQRPGETEEEWEARRAIEEPQFASSMALMAGLSLMPGGGKTPKGKVPKIPAKAGAVGPLGKAGEEAAQAPEIVAGRGIPETPITPAAGVGAGAQPPAGVRPPSAGGEVPPSLTKARIEVQQERGVPPPKPPKKPTVPKEPPPPEENGTLLARFLENQVDADAAHSDWAKFQGGLAAEGKEADLWMREGSKRTGIPMNGGKRTPEMEQLWLALQGEGTSPPKYQAVYDEINAYMREGERITLGDVPGFDRVMLKDPTYMTRKWRNWQIFDDLAREARGEPPRETGIPGRTVGARGRMPKGVPRRTLPKTFREALDMGAEPLTWNPYEMAAIHRAELAEYRYTNVLAQAWKETERAIPKSAAPRSWVTPPYKAFESRPYVNPEGTVSWSEPLVVSPEDAKVLPNILGEGFEGVENAAAYLTSVFKRSKVAFGLFQYWDLQNRTILRAISEGARLSIKGDFAGAARELEVLPAALKAWAGAFFPPLRPKLWRGLMDDPLIKMGIEEGGQPIGGLDVWKRTMRDSLKDDLVMRAPIIGDIPTKSLPPGVRQAVKGTQNVMNGIYRYIASGLYDAAHPQYWSTFYKSLYRQLRTQFPEYTDRQIAGMASKDTNIMMSSIPDWHSVLNPRLRQLGRGVAFSVNEGEAWLRMIPRTLRGKTANVYRQQWATYLFGTLAFAEVVNYGMTGELLTPEQLSPIVMRDGKPTYNNKFARPRLDGTGPVGRVANIKGPQGEHIYLDLMGQADTPFRILNPVFFVQTRLAPQLSTAVQELQSRRYFGGQPLETPGERATFAVEQLAVPIPAVGFGQERERIGTPGSVIQAAGWNVSAESTANLLKRLVPGYEGMTEAQRQEAAAANPQVAAARQLQLERGLERGEQWAETKQATQQEAAEFGTQVVAAYSRPGVSKKDITDAVSNWLQARANKAEVRYAGVEFKADSPDRKLLDEWYSFYDALPVVPTAADWDALYDKQDALEAANPRIHDLINQNHQAIFLGNPQMQAIMAEIDAAKSVRRDYYAIPAFMGLTADEGDQVSAIISEASAMVTYGLAPDREAAIMIIMWRGQYPRRIIMAALEGEGLRNPQRRMFKMQHPELQMFESLPVTEMVAAS